MDNTLSWQERKHFVQLLNNGGYVLNFSTADFNTFTEDIIGVPLCSEYGLSKGKSLERFLENATRSEAIKLLDALMKEWAIAQKPNAKKEELALGEACEKEIEALRKSFVPFESETAYLKATGFSSEYLDSRNQDLQICIRDGKATEAIGISKELVESCCKTILETSGENNFSRENIPSLLKDTMSVLNIGIDKINERTKTPETVKRLLGSLSQIVSSLAELRNEYGTGHGKSRTYTGLSQRHARLAAGAALTLTQYLWDTFLERNAGNAKE